MPEQGRVIDFAAAKRRRGMSTEPWIKKEELAAYFQVSTRTVYRWVNEGCPIRRLPGGSLRFQLGPVRDWIESR